MHIVLGSESPYRKHAFEALGHTVEVRPARIDERSIRHPDPLALTLALAKAKSQALLPTLQSNDILCTADTVGFLDDGTIVEKPRTADEARGMVARYNAGERIGFATAVMLRNATLTKSGVAVSYCTFSHIPSELFEETIQSGEAFRCAGGFTLSNDRTWACVKDLDGDKDVVVGFPSKLVISLLRHYEHRN
jgi:septum formation protein